MVLLLLVVFSAGDRSDEFSRSEMWWSAGKIASLVLFGAADGDDDFHFSASPIYTTQNKTHTLSKCEKHILASLQELWQDFWGNP